jgi:formylglycine-generating enzyme required for sulfatase activity
MPRCSVCQTRYTSNQTDRCPVCGWDVQPLTFVTGLIPEVAQKEAIRLEWAKQFWSRSKLRQEQLRQLQIQIQELSDREQRLQAQLEKADQEAVGLSEALHQRDITIANLQAKLEQAQAALEQAKPPPILPSLKSNERGAEPGENQTLEPSLQQSALEETHNRDLNLLEVPPFADATERIQTVPELADVSVSNLAKQVALEPFTFEVVIIRADGRQTQKQTASSLKEPLEGNITLEMVYIPAGRFLMGSPEAEAGRDVHESPLHPVDISPFLMSRFPITQAQWRAIAALPKIKRSLNLYPADFEGDDRPVEQVSWYDTIEFCARLSQKTGHHYRLPSEAEWEYACRAGTATPFHFGDTIAPDLANYDGIYTYSFGPSGVYRQETTPVLMFAMSVDSNAEGIANPFGLSDMHGNVWEWCADAWHETYDEAPNDGSAWESDDDVSYRILRGGAWYCLPELCRSAQRHWNQPDMSGSGIGFRVVRSVSR